MANKWLITKRIEDANFVKICNDAMSMAAAASILGLHFNSFKKRALKFGCYRPNQAGVGMKKAAPRIPLEEIIVKNLHPYYQSFKLKIRLVRERIKEHKCERCGIKEWKNQPLSMELHHKDGDRCNHLLENLLLLCPNCHSQTETFRAKNKKKLSAQRETFGAEPLKVGGTYLQKVENGNPEPSPESAGKV